MRVPRSLQEHSGHSTSGRRGLTLIELLVVIGIIGLLLALLLPATRSSGREGVRRAQCRNNIKQIGLALHNYHDAYGIFPPACTVDDSGRKLHSWRTLLLPYLDQAPLYARIDLTKPWDDPVNKAVAETAVEAYRCPSTKVAPHLTTYHAIVAADSVLRPEASRRIAEITDGTANTVVVIEVDTARAVPWMSPEDEGAEFFETLSEKSATAHQRGSNGLFTDGAVRFLGADLSADARKKLITATAGDGDVTW